MHSTFLTGIRLKRSNLQLLLQIRSLQPHTMLINISSSEKNQHTVLPEYSCHHIQGISNMATDYIQRVLATVFTQETQQCGFLCLMKILGLSCSLGLQQSSGPGQLSFLNQSEILWLRLSCTVSVCSTYPTSTAAVLKYLLFPTTTFKKKGNKNCLNYNQNRKFLLKRTWQTGKERV